LQWFLRKQKMFPFNIVPDEIKRSLKNLETLMVSEYHDGEEFVPIALLLKKDIKKQKKQFYDRMMNLPIENMFFQMHPSALYWRCMRELETRFPKLRPAFFQKRHQEKHELHAKVVQFVQNYILMIKELPESKRTVAVFLMMLLDVKETFPTFHFQDCDGMLQLFHKRLEAAFQGCWTPEFRILLENIYRRYFGAWKEHQNPLTSTCSPLLENKLFWEQRSEKRTSKEYFIFETESPLGLHQKDVTLFLKLLAPRFARLGDVALTCFEVSVQDIFIMWKKMGRLFFSFRDWNKIVHQVLETLETKEAFDRWMALYFEEPEMETKKAMMVLQEIADRYDQVCGLKTKFAEEEEEFVLVE
jgi:hypothetical protein